MSSSAANLEKFQLTWKKIWAATNKFSPQKKIGDGGYGTVYKGELSQDGKNRTVAIKRHNKNGNNVEEVFRKELQMVISSFKNHNIIEFIGYCDDGDEKIIVCEYASKGSLDRHLEDPKKRLHITFKQRMEICLGIAEGLKYLHSGLGEKEIIHRDIKSGNILLDDNLKAKIGDFGLSISVPRNQPQTAIFPKFAGTVSYIDPNYLESGMLSKESDIYSFGVIMFEMLTGMMAYHSRRVGKDQEANMMGHIRSCNEESRHKLQDSMVKGNIDRDNFNELFKIALDCVDMEKGKRPTADEIVRRIDKALPSLDIKVDKVDSDVRAYRIKSFADWKKKFELNDGYFEQFAKGYSKFGINREERCVVYREWAQPTNEAKLVVLNDMGESNHDMIKDKFGVWTVEIPDNDNTDSVITHKSKVRFRFKHNNGEWIDRVPAWINYTTSTDARYDGVYWDPPASERYEMKSHRPTPKPGAPLICIAHFGKSSSVSTPQRTFKEFKHELFSYAKKYEYDTIELKAVMEHSSYGPLGYDVTNFFAVNSSAGTPEDLKCLIDEAHELNLRVIMEVVHSHVSTNATMGLSGFDVGQPTMDSYFHTGERGYHTLWRSRLFNYSNWEVLRFLLSNLRWWLEEFKFDGFRFHGVTSMFYNHQKGNDNENIVGPVDLDAVVYMMLANELIHSILPDAIVITEDVPDMPDLCEPLGKGGIGFDFVIEEKQNKD